MIINKNKPLRGTCSLKSFHRVDTEFCCLILEKILKLSALNGLKISSLQTYFYLYPCSDLSRKGSLLSKIGSLLGSITLAFYLMQIVTLPYFQIFQDVSSLAVPSLQCISYFSSTFYYLCYSESNSLKFP